MVIAVAEPASIEIPTITITNETIRLGVVNMAVLPQQYMPNFQRLGKSGPNYVRVPPGGAANAKLAPGTPFASTAERKGPPLFGGAPCSGWRAGAASDRARRFEKLAIELHGEAYIFRNRGGAPYSKDTLGDDFRAVRRAEFGERDKRTLADFRRSGAVEAIAGDATAEQLAHAMGNTLSSSNALFATYVPVNLATIRSVMEARRRGRTKLR
jgi:hypothetical protein